MPSTPTTKLPKLGFLYLDFVQRFFDRSNFRGWPDPIEQVIYHWGNDKERFIREVRRKKIEVLIGNVPATAYETFREISRRLPDVRFIPDLDAQFANKSKENVTQLCRKYRIPIPHTEIFYKPSEADAYLKKVSYPRIVKKSYGPSNYGGYYVHKVDSYQEARALMDDKKYHPVYVQEFVPMKADIRVMLIGHRPVCAFWRRPPQGEWLTNTSQGGSMDYQDVPQQALDLAVRVSQAANAEYWACDIAVGFDGKMRILECATAFAAFPYIRDWIGQYLMWKLSDGRFPEPHIPLYNWEELGKIQSSLLRTMRHICFSHGGETALSTTDSAELFGALDVDNYPILDTLPREGEEWPSEVWNRQGLYPLPIDDPRPHVRGVAMNSNDESAESPTTTVPAVEEETTLPSPGQMRRFLAGVKGIGKNQYEAIIETLGIKTLVHTLRSDGSELLRVKSIKEKRAGRILESWRKNPSL